MSGFWGRRFGLQWGFSKTPNDPKLSGPGDYKKMKDPGHTNPARYPYPDLESRSPNLRPYTTKGTL